MTAKFTIADHASDAPLNVTARSTAPTNPALNDVYLDDGTNTDSGNPGWRRYDGTAWADVSGGGGNNIVEIASVTLTSDQASITFASIPGIYDHLKLVINGETDRALIRDSMRIELNGDTTTSNYWYSYLRTENTTVSGAATNNNVIGQLTGNVATANALALNVLDFMFYAETTNDKMIQMSGGYAESGSLGFYLSQLTRWNNTNAITQIVLKPTAGTNFVAGSKFTLYGISG